MCQGNIARGDLSLMTIRYGLAAIAVIVASASVPAGAQPQPVAIPAKDFGPVWTGFYVGAAFGAGGAVNKLDSTTPALSTTFDGGGGSGVRRRDRGLRPLEVGGEGPGGAREPRDRKRAAAVV